MRLTKAVLLALPCLLALSHPASAQEARRKVSVELQARVAHDTNVLRFNEAAADALGLDTSDTVFSPTLAVDVLLPLSRQAFFLRGVVARDYYEKNDGFESDRFNLTGGFNLHAGICDGALIQTFQRSRGAPRSLGVLVLRNVDEFESTSFNATCGRAVGFAPSFSITRSEGDNTTPLLASSDYESLSTTAGLAYRRPGFGRLEVYGRRTETDQPHRLYSVGGGLQEDGYELTGYGVRYERRLGARLGGEVDVAFTKVEPNAPGVADFDGVTYGATVEYRANPRLDLAARIERAVTPSSQLGAAYSVTDNVRLDAEYALGSRLSLRGGVSRSEYEYEGASLIPGTFITRERLNQVTAEARYDMNRRIAFLADVTWEDRNSDVPQLSYDSTRVGVGAVAKF